MMKSVLIAIRPQWVEKIASLAKKPNKKCHILLTNYQKRVTMKYNP